MVTVAATFWRMKWWVKMGGQKIAKSTGFLIIKKEEEEKNGIIFFIKQLQK